MAGNNDYARLNLIVGSPGTGKSSLTDKIIAKTHFKNAIVYIEGIDQGGTPFKGLPVLQPPIVYKGGKVCIDADSMKITDLINALCLKYRNGLFIIDEAGMYKHEMFVKGEPVPPLLKLLKQRRKYNIEMYFIYHSASEIPVQIFKFVNNLILFHQTDMFAHKAGVIPRIAELNAAKLRIEKKYFDTSNKNNRYYCERIQLS